MSQVFTPSIDRVTDRGALRKMAALLVGCFVVLPLIAAPLAIGHEYLRPLTISNSLRVTPAFGPDDEDCVYEISRSPRPDGQFKVTKKLICDE
jgi:hypothetical protein